MLRTRELQPSPRTGRDGPAIEARAEGLGRRASQARAFYAVIATSILLGVTMDFAGVGPIRALYLAAMLNGAVAPPLLLLILLLARSRAVLGEHRSGPLSQLVVDAAALVMAALSVLAVLR
jgi:Mn2+/Fe2+ NRAMP family transporter